MLKKYLVEMSHNDGETKICNKGDYCLSVHCDKGNIRAVVSGQTRVFSEIQRIVITDKNGLYVESINF